MHVECYQIPLLDHFCFNETHLNDSFQALGSLNCSQRSEDTTDTQDLQDGHCSSAGEVVKDMDLMVKWTTNDGQMDE